MNEIQCKYKPKTPEGFGYSSWSKALKAIVAYPNLRPCIKNKGFWIEKRFCDKCENRSVEK